LLRRIAERTFDLVVIGGGITGVGTALDAVSRGLSVALLEAGDLAGGTSSRSGKVFHGGLRYLEQLNFSLVRQALTERDLMVDRLCPHLVSPEPFLFPFTRRWERPYVGAGVLLYDLLRLRGTRSVPGHRHLTRRGVLRQMPALHPGRITGGVRYHDVRVDDARHTLTVARTAAGLGAQVLTRMQVVGMLWDGDRIAGVRARDVSASAPASAGSWPADVGLPAAEFPVRARCVVNAAGVWAEQVQALAGRPSISVTVAKGIHLVVPGDRIDSRTGLIARTPDSVFILRRWFDHWLLGTTDTRWEHGPADPAATRSDVDYLLGQANRWLRAPLGAGDVVGIYAGLRPLVSGPAAVTAALSRDHVVVSGPPGMVTVVGGKYTTYRLMARDAVDACARWLGRLPVSGTEWLPILGAAGHDVLRGQRSSLAAESGVDEWWIGRLLGRYGSLTTDLLDLIADRPELGRPVPGATGYLAAELHYAASHEAAMTLEDALVRRTRIFMETRDRGLAAARHAAGVVGEVLGWDETRRDEEVVRYRLEREADRRAAAALTDQEAVTARRAVRGTAASSGCREQM
jgi:glycerol-3-phosphate dehydrogenase